MRLSEDKIKQAILHPEEEIRHTALRYFTEAHRRDEALMPVVIEAVQRFGRERSFSLLRGADRLVQTESTVDWLVGELAQDVDTTDVVQDNYRFAVGIVLCNADPAFLAPRREEILQAPSFPAELEQTLEQVVESSSWDWATAWQEFERLGQELSEKKWRLADHRRMRISIELLARRPDARPSEVMQLLRRRFRGYNKSLTQWLEPQLVELAGEMRLTEAVPLLIDRLAEDDDQVGDAAITALAKIGGDEIVRAIQKEWPTADEELRRSMGDVLEHLRSDLCLRACLELLPEEDDLDTAITLGHAIVSQFAPEAIEPVRELVQGETDDLDPEEMELRHHLVAAAAIMEVSFPEFDQWLAEARSTNWGWGDLVRPFRLAENFRRDFDISDDELFDDEDEGEEFGGPAEIDYVRTRRLDADETCPCGSGKEYGDCCWEKDFEWVEDEDGYVYRSAPVPGELRELLDQQREAFVAEHGREPGPDDMLFPQLPHPEHLEAMAVEAMKEAGVPPAIIYAFEQTGLLVTEENQNNIPDVDLARWQAAVEEYERRYGGESLN